MGRSPGHWPVCLTEGGRDESRADRAPCAEGWRGPRGGCSPGDPLLVANRRRAPAQRRRHPTAHLGWGTSQTAQRHTRRDPIEPPSREEAAATRPGAVTITLPADVNQVDDTGFVWAILGGADEPERVRPRAIIVAGDAVEPFLARVVDIVDGPRDDSIVHLDVLGVPDQTIDELRHAGLLSA